MTPLYERYRPRAWDEVVGQDEALGRLDNLDWFMDFSPLFEVAAEYRSKVAGEPISLASNNNQFLEKKVQPKCIAVSLSGDAGAGEPTCPPPAR